MVGVGRPAQLFAYGMALSGRCRVANGRGERSARAGEVVKSGPGRLWAEGRNPARKADMDGLHLVNDATLSRSTESCIQGICEPQELEISCESLPLLSVYKRLS